METAYCTGCKSRESSAVARWVIVDFFSRFLAFGFADLRHRFVLLIFFVFVSYVLCFFILDIVLFCLIVETYFFYLCLCLFCCLLILDIVLFCQP